MDRLDPALDLDIGEEALVAADQPGGEERGDRRSWGLLTGRRVGAQSCCAAAGRHLYNPAEEGAETE